MDKKKMTLAEFCKKNNKEDLLKSWDYDKNKEFKVTPENISYGSTKKVWWKCEKGHSRFTSVNNRRKSNNCLYCLDKKALEGYNDLNTTHPNVAKRWNYRSNVELKPTDITYSSSKMIWWTCSSCNRDYQRNVSLEIAANKCPLCNNKYE